MQVTNPQGWLAGHRPLGDRSAPAILGSVHGRIHTEGRGAGILKQGDVSDSVAPTDARSRRSWSRVRRIHQKGDGVARINQESLGAPPDPRRRCQGGGISAPEDRRRALFGLSRRACASATSPSSGRTLA